MPNWCEGILKIRGRRENVLSFLRNGCEQVDGEPSEIFESSYEEIYISECELWIKNGQGHFIETNMPYDEQGVIEDENGEIVWCCILKGAWDIDTEVLQNVSSEYHLDLKIHAFERGQQFERIIEICRGGVIIDEYIKHDGYNDWLWNAELPFCGG